MPLPRPLTLVGSKGLVSRAILSRACPQPVLFCHCLRHGFPYLGFRTYFLQHSRACKNWQLGGLRGDAREGWFKVAGGGFPSISAQGYIKISKLNINNRTKGTCSSNLANFYWWKYYTTSSCCTGAIKIIEETKENGLLTIYRCTIFDEMGQYSAEFLATFDIILRKVMNSNILFGGVLVIFSMNHTQIQPICVRPFLT